MSTGSDPAALSAAKRALLEQRLGGNEGLPGFPRRPASAAPVLSPGQRRLWFLHQLAPESSAYTMFDARRLAGKIDVTLLRACLAEVVQTHEILRTRYEQRDGRPVPVVSTRAVFDFEVMTATGAAFEVRERQAKQLATAFIRRNFDLESGPVLRAAVIEGAGDDCIFVLAVHHIACDEWSLDIVWRELAEGYAARSAGRVPQPHSPPLQYADYAHWQATRSAAASAHLDYWRTTLADCPPPLELPADRVPPVRRAYIGGTVAAGGDEEVAVRLAAIARAAGTTRFVLHLAAFVVLLHRHTGDRDLVVGVPATGRNEPALESVVGFFLNTLALRLDVAHDVAFLDLLRQVHAVFLDGLTHRDVPFEQVVDALAPERRLSRNPLFSMMFVEQGRPVALSFGEGVTVSRYALDGGGSKFDLTLFAGERDGGLDVMVEYDAERFERTTAERLLDQYRTLLAGIAADADRAISKLPLASVAEKRLVQSWSRGPALAAAFPVHERFAAHAHATPDRAAALDARGSVSYGTLLRRADGVASLLLANGLMRGERVGLCADRSVDLVAGMLGVLRAGGAYVPLDPEYPPARLDAAMGEAGVRLVVAAPVYAARVTGAGRLGLPLGGRDGRTDAIAFDPPLASLDDPAYVIHTSGSTGTPRGVLVTHRNLAGSTAARDVAYPEPPDVFLLLPSFAFDSSVAGIFWTLAAGGTLAIPPKRIEQDVHALATFISHHGVTHTLCLPSLWETILELAPIEQLRSLRTVIVAGEACSTHLVGRHYDALPDVALWNEYGPTEATVWCSAYPIPRGFAGTRVPIGRPVAGARLHVLAPDGEPVPIGIAGELWVGGTGVASYLDRSDEADARFAPDRYSGEPGARLYRTGDLARWRDDGLLEFLGRTDQQVKVRGFRIEPAEIESMLRRHSAVRDAVVGIRPAGTNAGRQEADTSDRIVAALHALPVAEVERLLAVVEGIAPVEVSA